MICLGFSRKDKTVKGFDIAFESMKKGKTCADDGLVAEMAARRVARRCYRTRCRQGLVDAIFFLQNEFLPFCLLVIQSIQNGARVAGRVGAGLEPALQDASAAWLSKCRQEESIAYYKSPRRPQNEADTPQCEQ